MLHFGEVKSLDSVSPFLLDELSEGVYSTCTTGEYLHLDGEGQSNKTSGDFAVCLGGWLFKVPVVVVLGGATSVSNAERVQRIIQSKLDSVVKYVNDNFDMGEMPLKLEAVLAKKKYTKWYTREELTSGRVVLIAAHTP